MTEALQTKFRKEGEVTLPIKDNETEDSSESSTEETTEDQTQSDEGEQTQTQKKDDPGEEEQEEEGQEGEEGEEEGEKGKGDLHDNPRWQKREEDWKERFNKQEENHASELQKLREDFDEKFDGLNKKKEETNTSEPKPSWFGGNDEQWSEFLKWNQTLMSKSEERSFEKMSTVKADDQKRVDEATQYLNSQIQEIENDSTLNPSGSKIDRNKLLKITLDNDLVDSKGQWNYKAGWAIMNNKGPAKPVDTSERKKLAGATTGDRRSETKKSGVMTSKDFSNPSNRPW